MFVAAFRAWQLGFCLIKIFEKEHWEENWVCWMVVMKSLLWRFRRHKKGQGKLWGIMGVIFVKLFLKSPKFFLQGKGNKNEEKSIFSFWMHGFFLMSARAFSKMMDFVNITNEVLKTDYHHGKIHWMNTLMRTD